jgi:DNA polymerase
MAAVPEDATLAVLRDAAADCRACELWKRGTQTVVGEGEELAPLMLVGEQPGDQEDREGRPFVGPAGKLLDRALTEAGIERELAYVTNAVKHFKWKPQQRGKRRIHDKPSWTEIGACLPWLHAEIAAVHPKVVVCLGATAAQALLGRDVRVTRDRGRPLETPHAQRALVTVHPSSILRSRDDASRKEAMDAFVADLRVAAAELRAVERAA